jgi:hypothetical protein
MAPILPVLASRSPGLLWEASGRASPPRRGRVLGQMKAYRGIRIREVNDEALGRSLVLGLNWT